MASLQETLPTALSDGGLEPRAAALEQFLELHQVWILGIWTVIYFVGTILRARGKPFWYDEVLTLMEARQHTLAGALRAFGDMDWMPPVSHWVFYLSGKLTGYGEAGFRLPVMAAFWIFCVCLYVFARRRVGVFFALMALLLPFSTTFQGYSFEARSYAFMLASCGIALIAWQAAADGIRRPWSLALLSIGIAGSIAFQYWGVLIYFPLACGEAYRNFRNRRVDWPMWIAMLAGVIPLVVSLPLILHGMRTWAPYGDLHVHPRSYFDFYRKVFQVSIAFLLPAGLLLGLWLLAGGRKEKPASRQEAAVPIHEWITAAALLLIPVVAISIALVLPPHDFMPRYAIPALAGFALLIAFAGARLAGRRSSAGLALAVAALAPFLYLMARPHHLGNPFHRARSLREQLQTGPVMVDDLILYLPLWYYTPPHLKSHMVYLAAKRSHRAVDKRMQEFSRLNVPIAFYDEFDPPGKQFLLYSRLQSRVPRRIETEGGSLETVRRFGRHTLFLVHLP